ncbi:hypothetical protein DFH06DRAFT_1232823 [Mycena polygramma]|nr:hypothetical protein DFH06DRAFT_1232823 [Mycena polygramma]
MASKGKLDCFRAPFPLILSTRLFHQAFRRLPSPRCPARIDSSRVNALWPTLLRPHSAASSLPHSTSSLHSHLLQLHSHLNRFAATPSFTLQRARTEPGICSQIPYRCSSSILVPLRATRLQNLSWRRGTTPCYAHCPVRPVSSSQSATQVRAPCKTQQVVSPPTVSPSPLGRHRGRSIHLLNRCKPVNSRTASKMTDLPRKTSAADSPVSCEDTPLPKTAAHHLRDDPRAHRT